MSLEIRGCWTGENFSTSHLPQSSTLSSDSTHYVLGSLSLSSLIFLIGKLEVHSGVIKINEEMSKLQVGTIKASMQPKKVVYMALTFERI